LKAVDIEEVRRNLRGELLTAGQDGYDSARKIWNGAFDRKPAIIMRCAGAADVTCAVDFGAAHELLTAIRAGGHSLSGQSACDGGLMIDLSPMSGIRVDPLARTARVEPGVLLGQFDREAQAFGLATTAGTVSHTGVAGLTLGGGFGRLARKYGLACDNLVGADVVTAAGRFVRASAQENPDLLWGLRGGGGNFGVVTSLEFRLHSVAPTVYGGQLVYPIAHAGALLRHFADFISGAPDDLYVEVRLEGRPGGEGDVRFDVCYCGPPSEAERWLSPLRQLGEPLQDQLAPAHYSDLQRMNDGSNPHGRGYYVKSGYLRALTPAVIDAVVDTSASSPPTAMHVGFVPFGGAIARVKPTATAYWHRDPTHALVMVVSWQQSSDAQRSTQWAHETWAKLQPLTTGFYVNLAGKEDTERRAHAAYGDNYPRLAALKKQYDPDNLFRLNANIKPA
jgi:FAD/FMN-containing dehydrogenase